MKFKKISSFPLKHQKTWCVVLEKGDEFISSLIKFCESEKICCGSFSAIGATDNVEIGFFNTQIKQYEKKQFNEDMEIISLIGNISLVNNSPFIHTHIVCSTNQVVFAGHLFMCVVSLTCEIFVSSFKTKIKRIPSPLGIKTIEL